MHHNMGIDVSTILQERERELLERQRKTEMQSADNLRDVQEKIDLQESNQQKMCKALGSNFGNQQILLEQFVALQQANVYLQQENQLLNQALTDRDRQVDQVQQKNQVLESRVCQMETQLNQVMKMLEAINSTERANAAAKTSSTFFQQP